MKKTFLISALFCVTQLMWAAPAAPGTTVFIQPDGTQLLLELRGDEYYHYLVNAQGERVEKGSDGFYRPVETMTQQTFLQRRKAAKKRRDARTPAQTEPIYNPAPRGIVIVAGFADLPCQPATTRQSMDEMCNGDNYTYDGAYGSAKKYFEDQSSGTYIPQFDVFGPITLPKTMAYYGANDEQGGDVNAGEAIIDACRILDQQENVDFSLYDSDRDGRVDFVYLIYAGYGENFAGSDPNTIWPHKWTVSFYPDEDITYDGVTLATYACSAELNGSSGTTRCGIGTLCHEFSHVLGLPDYYDTQYGENYDNNLIPGSWDIMSGGNHLLEGHSPCNYTVHEKFQFGWATPEILNRPQDITLSPSGNYYYIATDGREKTPVSPDTVYYLENRQKTGWDRGVPGHGLMIWRVVYDEEKWNENGPNDTPGEANYIYLPANGIYNGGNAGDPYPGLSRVTSFEVPNTIYGLNDITETEGNINIRFFVGCDGYTVDVNATKANVIETQTGNCYPAHSAYTATIQPMKTYFISDLTVTMGGLLLFEGIDYTYIGEVLTIPSLTGDVQIDVTTEKIPFDYDHCMYFFWHADSAVQGSHPVLSDINWTLSATGSTYRGFDSPATDRGAQFGSRSTSPGDVTLYTTEMSNCLITKVQVVACVAKGSGTIEAVLDDENLGTQQLQEKVSEYVFDNPEGYHGALELRFRNLEHALFIRRITIHFADETDNPNGLDAIQALPLSGEILGIYSITGQYFGDNIVYLPQGLYIVHRADGTEKILIQ